MRSNPEQLVEFVFTLIDVQIKKYSRLAEAGVGPDAKTSAALIRSQVNDLLELLKHYLNLEKPSQNDVLTLAQSVKFYLDCEYLRGRAGWLLDDNNIHNTVYERVSTQKKELGILCERMEGWVDIDRMALTSVQQQYLHDSHAIAFRILNIAVRLKEDPECIDLDKEKIPPHALKIIRRHAQPGGRYHDDELGAEIVTSFRSSEDYLDHSLLKKSAIELDKEAAATCRVENRAAFQTLLTTFLDKHPNRSLANADFKWLEVAEIPARPVEPTARPLIKWGLFAAGFAIAVAYAAIRNNNDTPDDNRLISWLGL